jgi:diguanylate cyclase (GGDEF)-like protein/PAS domain S-box-containing protein
MDVQTAEPSLGALDGEASWRELVEGSPDLNTVVNVEGVFCYVSSASRPLFGWGPAELVGHREDDFVRPDDLAYVHAGRAALAETGSATINFRFLCRDGSDRWVQSTCRRVEAGGSTWVVSALRDMTPGRAQTISLEHQASSDPLTGVANRTVLMDRLQQALRRMTRGGGVLALLYLDLDRFKVVNDSLGHRAGDAVLLEMAARLTHHVRPSDTVARLGGDEFVVLAEGLKDEQEAVALGGRIIVAAREPFRVGSEEFVCTISVGIVCTTDSQRDADELLGEADMALYRAKDRGRDRAEAFDVELRTRAVGRLVTERLLRRALEEDRVVIEYQPIVDLRSGHPVAAEALLRILGTDGALILPPAFLEVAEETGLLVAMDQRVLADAANQAEGWQSRLAGTGFAEVGINITARHLADASFQRTVVEQLDAHGVRHRLFQIDLTERSFLEASHSAMTGLVGLRAAGVQVGLDDFGTGYSSLSHLRTLPLDYIKVDGALTRELEHDRHVRAICAAIVTLAHALDLVVVAEGVETVGQLEVLLELDCDRAQGFLFAASGAPQDVERLVSREPDDLDRLVRRAPEDVDRLVRRARRAARRRAG